MVIALGLVMTCRSERGGADLECSSPSAVALGKHPRGLPERHNQVHRETEIERHRQYRHGEPDRDCDHIADCGGQ